MVNSVNKLHKCLSVGFDCNLRDPPRLVLLYFRRIMCVVLVVFRMYRLFSSQMLLTGGIFMSFVDCHFSSVYFKLCMLYNLKLTFGSLSFSLQQPIVCVFLALIYPANAR